MDEDDGAAVRRTEPADAAEEGYPIDEAMGPDAQALVARAASAPAAEGLSAGELRSFAERYLSTHPGADVDAFLMWLASTRQ